jgi:hypothetical protein
MDRNLYPFTTLKTTGWPDDRRRPRVRLMTDDAARATPCDPAAR